MVNLRQLAQNEDSLFFEGQMGARRQPISKPSFPDTVPILMVDEQPIRLAPKLEWYELVWACFPIVLLFVGGAIGGLLGAGGAAFNIQIFRSKMPVAARYALAGVITFCCLLLFIIVGSMIQAAIRR